MNISESQKEKPWLEYKLNFDMNGYNLAILKIIYELAYYWLHEKYLNDTIAERLRTAIINGCIEDSQLNGKISIGKAILPQLKLNKQSLSALAVVDGNRINIFVKIFDIFEGAITVTQNAAKYSMTLENAPYIEINVCNHKKIVTIQ
jgi:hypothetical protein